MTITNYTDRELALHARVKELEALIEASRKQERVGIVKQKRNENGTFVLWNKYPTAEMELFAAPVVAPDVKQYGDDRAREALEMAAKACEAGWGLASGDEAAVTIRALAKEIK